MPLSRPTTVTRNYDVQAGVQNKSRTLYLSSSTPRPKVAGGFITLPDGSKFRRTTNYNRSENWIEFGNAQNDTGIRKNISSSPPYDIWLRSSPGGWNPDSYRASYFYNFFQGIPEVGFGSQGLSSVPVIPAMSRNEAQVKALLQLADSKANMGENLGTLGQTLRMLSHPVTTLVGGFKSVYSNRSLRPFIRESYESLRRKGLLTAAAEKYLEFVYGWRPLMQDIHGLIALAKESGDRPLMLKGKHTASREMSVGSKYWTNISDSVVNTITGGTASSKVKCVLHARIDPNWTGSRALNQLGLANPLALAWELTTMSFVIDWLLPIGPVLNALTAPAGLVFVNGSISNRLSATCSYNDHTTLVESRANYQYNGGPDASGIVRYEGYTRSEITSWPVPGFWIDPDPLRGDRWLKALALAIANSKSYR